MYIYIYTCISDTSLCFSSVDTSHPSSCTGGYLPNIREDTDSYMQMLPLAAATSFKHRGPQYILILTRSTSPP